MVQLITYAILLILVATNVLLLIINHELKNRMVKIETQKFIDECDIYASIAIDADEAVDETRLTEPPYAVIRSLQQQDDVLDRIYNLYAGSIAHGRVFRKLGISLASITRLRVANTARMHELKMIEVNNLK